MTAANRAATIAAWALIALSILGVLGSIGIGTIGGAVVWVIIGLAAAGYLATARRRRASAAAAEIAARAERENELYFKGDITGLYGQFGPPA